MRSCQNPILCDQVLLNIPHMEGAIFNIKFTYLTILDVTWDFWFFRVIQNILKTQYKCKLHLAKYENCNTQLYHNTSVIPTTDLCNMLTIMMWGGPSCQEGIHGLKPAQVYWSLRNSFVSCLVFILYVRLSHIFTPPMLVWLIQGDTWALTCGSAPAIDVESLTCFAHADPSQ